MRARTAGLCCARGSECELLEVIHRMEVGNDQVLELHFPHGVFEAVLVFPWEVGFLILVILSHGTLGMEQVCPGASPPCHVQLRPEVAKLRSHQCRACLTTTNTNQTTLVAIAEMMH